ncbi:MAG: hypothetical protein RLZZ127_3239 [Planctomycetota bacterium]|jgi:uncharacterized protein (DUF58 family)
MHQAARTELIPTAELAKLHHLDVVAKLVVEGLQNGAHRSPHLGVSVDFADHRAYVPGDDLRHLDWKVLGRSDRLVVKRYEQETDLACTVVVDGSASMGYRGSRAAVSKYRYAAMVAASLSYLVLAQQDRAGLVLFSDRPVVELRASAGGQLVRICRALEAHDPAGATDGLKATAHLVGPDSHRGLVVLISDLVDDPAVVEGVLDRLARRGHDVACLWLLDPDELDLGVGTVSRFEHLEGPERLVAEPRALRTAYREVVETHRQAIQAHCRRRRMAFASATTDEPLALPLNRLLLALHAERR